MIQVRCTTTVYRHAHEAEFADRFLLRLAVLAPQERQGALAVAVSRVLQAEAIEQGAYLLVGEEKRS